MAIATTHLAQPIAGAEPSTRWPPAIWAMLGATFFVRAAGFCYPFLAYRLTEIGFSGLSIGYVLATFGVGWLVGQLLCGWLSDLLGCRATLVSSLLTGAVALVFLAQAQTIVAVVAASFITGVCYDASRPILSAVVAELIPTESGRAAVNSWRIFATNVGSAATGAVGGLLAGRAGLGLLFWINAGAYAVAAVCLYLALDAPARLPAVARTSYRAVRTDGQLWLLSLVSVFALTCTSGLFSALPMLMTEDGLSAAAYGLTQLANAGAVIILAPMLTPWLRRRAARNQMVGTLAASSLILGASMGAAALASTTFGYSVAAVLAVPGEVLLMVAAADVLNRISPPDQRGLYAGIWGSTIAISVIVSPILAAWSISTGGDLLTAGTTLMCGLLGAALCLPLNALVHKSAPPSVECSPAAGPAASAGSGPAPLSSPQPATSSPHRGDAVRPGAGTEVAA